MNIYGGIEMAVTEYMIAVPVRIYYKLQIEALLL